MHLTCCASLHSQDVRNAARINHKQKGVTGSRPGPHGGLLARKKTFSAFFRIASFSLISLQSFFAVRFFDTCEPRFAPFAIKSNDAGIVKLRIALFYRRKSIRGVYALTLAWPLYSRANPFHKTKIHVAQLSLARHLRLLKRHK